MTSTAIFTPLFRSAVLLHLTGMAAAHKEDVSGKALAEVAGASDAINRAISQLMIDQDIEPADLQPLMDAITAELTTTEGDDQ